ncbi:MAG: glycosyltransferase [Nitrospirae bacterium]|nr:glycosyltransferase [Nitrospirota bacterium]
MKNILILDTGKEWGGGTNSLLELLRRINTKDCKFTALFYHNYSKPPETDIKAEIERLGIDFLLFEHARQPIYTKVLKEVGRTILFFNRKVRKLFIFWIDYLFRIKKDAVGITKLLKDLKIDLLYMNNQPSSNLEGIIAAKTAGIKSLLHSRIETDLNSFEVSAVNKWLTKMICVSEGVRGSFVRQGIESSKCITVYNGIDAGTTPAIPPHEIRRELGIKEEEFVIGSVGSLVRRKRFDDLIKAISYLSSQFTEHRAQKSDTVMPNLFRHLSFETLKQVQGLNSNKIKCIIVGEGPERESLQKEINRNKLNDRVLLAGFKSDAISYINAMDIFVLPSEREGFPRVILEAMLMGKPVIAANIAGPSELVIDNKTGFLFNAGDVKGLSACISELLLSQSLRIAMGEAGRKRAIENFSIKKYVSRVSSIIGEAAG